MKRSRRAGGDAEWVGLWCILNILDAARIQIRSHLRCGLVAQIRVFREAPPQDSFHVGRDRRRDDGILVHDVVGDRDHGIADERLPTREHFV